MERPNEKYIPERLPPAAQQAIEGTVIETAEGFARRCHEAVRPDQAREYSVASASVRDDISAAAVVFAPEYGSEDDDQIRSHICRRDCAGSTSPDSLAPEA